MMERQLTAVLYADVAGYSRLTELDEEQTHNKLAYGLSLLTEVINVHRGQKVHEAGDAVLAEFQSITSAVNSAVKFQRNMAVRNAELPEDERLEFRIGVHLGEVIRDRDDIYGDSVNISARIQELAESGGICTSSAAYDQVHTKVEHIFEDLGYQNFKNIEQSVRVYAIKLFDTPSRKKQGQFFDTLGNSRPLITGGCLCGEIRYEINGEDLGTTYCHCRMCQLFTTAPASPGTGFLKKDFRITQGEPKTYVSSLIAERVFCPTCSTCLWMSWYEYPDRLYLQTMTMDNPEKFPPVSHMGIESQISWHNLHDDLPRLSCEDSPEIVEAWESVGVSKSDPPRNFNVLNKTDK
jgi:adenylate cyclase